MAKKSVKRQSAATTTMPVNIVISVETIMSLINRVDALEARVKDAEDTAQANFDTLIEFVPARMTDGAVKAKVFALSGDGYDTVAIPFAEVLEENAD